MARSLFLVLAVIGAAAWAPATEQTGAVKLFAARRFGYFIGDLIRYDAVVTVDPSWTLRTSSLPTPGRSEYWLELRKVDVEESRAPAQHVYRIHLLYQIFYAPIEARARELPGFVLSFEHQARSAEVGVPALTVTMSPLREVATGTGDPEQNVALAPDRGAALSSLRRPAALASVASALSVGLCLLVTWQRAAWPFARRRERPFARVAHALRAGDTDNPRKYAAALLSIHRAFDATAGWRVFGDDQARFFVQHPRFAAAAAEIGSFFEASRSCFFGGDEARALVQVPPQALRRLARHLAALERGA
jgi:mxaA protein